VQDTSTISFTEVDPEQLSGLPGTPSLSFDASSSNLGTFEEDDFHHKKQERTFCKFEIWTLIKTV